jgi:LacI family transcriptional regulator
VKQVTLDDIAQRVSLSKFSVSRALSGKTGVSEDTRRLVIRAARELGYQHPTLTEREVSTNRNIILLIPREDVHDGEFWMEVISGAEAEAERLGFGLVTRPLANDALSNKPSPQWMQGLIVAGSKAREAMASYLEMKIPITLITYPKPLELFDTVTIADWEGAYVAGRHLIELGHTRLAFVSDRPYKPSNAERARGFIEVIAAHKGIQFEEFHIQSDEPSISFEKAYAAALERGTQPTALFASTDGVAFNVMWALNRLGLKVPEDVSVVGFNDTIQASQFVPKLTTLRVPKRHIGAVAMQSLYRRIKGEDGPARRLSLPPEFILRDSTGPAPH